LYELVEKFAPLILHATVLMFLRTGNRRHKPFKTEKVLTGAPSASVINSAPH